MRKINKTEAPSFLQTEYVRLAIAKMKKFFQSDQRSQKRYKWIHNRTIDTELKEYLSQAFNGKCGYCESVIDPKFGSIDRYRPNNGVREINEYYQDLYWWLTFEWRNLIYCCSECNQYKANYFPITGKRARSSKDDLNNENPLLLNPYEDNINEHIIVNYLDCTFSGKTSKGKQTIALLRLNRDNLISQRKETKSKIYDLLLKGKSEGSLSNLNTQEFQLLYQFIQPDDKSSEPHIFFGNRYIRHLSEGDFNNLLNEYFQVKEQSDPDTEIRKTDIHIPIITNDYFPIEYIHIKNFKSITDLRIEFKVDEPDEKSWLFLLGENGVGKSSILQALALGLKSDDLPIKEYGFSESLIKKGEKLATIEIKERNIPNTLYTTLSYDGSKFTINQEGKFNSYLIGYGSLRLSVEEFRELEEDPNQNSISKISYTNLFKPTKALNDITKWLVSIYKNDKVFFNRIAYSVKQLLPHDKSDTDLFINEENQVVLGDSNITDLSDGYKSTITLAVDIMRKLSDAHSDMDKMSGIVLIDELGNQLHPSWQMRIVTQLRTVFPKINFVVSTHNPLCLRGAKQGEIVLLKNIDNKVVALQELPDPNSLRIDQILASEFFGLNSLIDPELEAKFNRYYELLAKNNDENKAEIDTLRDFLANKKQLGNSLRDELMYSVIDKLLAQKVVFSNSSIDRNSLKDDAIQRVKEVWQNLNLYEND